MVDEMRSFPRSTMDWDLGGEKFVGIPCEVRIGAAELVISYMQKDREHVWHGTSIDGSTYVITHDGRPHDTAALTRTDEFTLDGAWIETSETGNWRIELADKN